MKTKTKVFLASMASLAISIARGVAGKGSTLTVARGGVRWELDLTEGIDFAIYLLGGFERSTGRALRDLVRPGDTVFDIGANIGAHTLPVAWRAGKSGRVFAFEPTDYAFGKLKKNISLNPQLEGIISAHQTMLADDPHTPVREGIYSSWPLRAGGTVHPKHRGRLETTHGASTDTIDAFATRLGIGRLDMIKIDVDGNEYPVLHGGVETLRRLRPKLLMEVSPYVHGELGNSFASLIELLRSIGYSLEEVGNGRQLPLSAEELERMIPDGSGVNAIAWQESR